MRKYLALAALVSALAATACDGAGSGAILGPEDTGPAYLLPPIDEGGGDCCGGGGGETGGGTTTPPPSPQYRISADLYVDHVENSQAHMRAWSRFEQLVGTSWVKIDASSLSVSCSGPGVSDSDSESNAGFIDVEFDAGPYVNGAFITISCYHQATYGGVTYTATTSESFTWTYL